MALEVRWLLIINNFLGETYLDTSISSVLLAVFRNTRAHAERQVDCNEV